MIKLWNRGDKGERVLHDVVTAEDLEKLKKELEQKIAQVSGGNGNEPQNGEAPNQRQ